MKILKYLTLSGLAIFSLILLINSLIYIQSKSLIYSQKQELPQAYTAIVPGAYVYKTGYLSGILQDRVETAYELYKTGKVQRFLLSGDHGRKDYDEVNSMKNYLLNKDVKTEDIFLDHAGFDTYSTIVRAKEVFEVDNAIIVTQKFHLPRALYIAKKKNINANGLIADKRYYPALMRLRIREVLACVKAYTNVKLNRKPKFLGPKIPITGDSSLSYD